MNQVESQHIEWKESWRDDLLRWVSGFANAQGGRLEIGRNNKGGIVGLADAYKLLEELPNKIRDLLGIIVAVNLHQTDGKAWIVIEVDAYPNPISYRGHYYIRSSSTLQELKGAALDRFLLRRQGRTWDGVPVPKVDVGHLSAQAIGKFREMAARSGRLDPADLRVPDAELIDKLKLTEGKYLKRAALLLFHPDPERYVTACFVKIGYFRTAAVLPEGWSLENLLAEHASTPFNPDVANAFFRAGEIETWGRGIKRIFEACENAGTPAPKIDYKPNDLWIEFPFSPEYLKAITPPDVTAPDAAPVTAPVGEYVEKLLHLLGQREPLGNEEIRLAFALKSRRRLRETYIVPAMASGLIEYTIPDKPNSRLQKYRLTEKGRSIL